MRNLDHFVMPVADLASARTRFQSLGFTVAPNARHPFGTENCCVFFGDGTFIEPLAIGDPQLCKKAYQQGNAFIANDKRFRAAQQLGFSQLVIQSKDAAADDKHYVLQAASGGKLLDFARQFTRSDGTQGEVAFRLAFAAPKAKADQHEIKTGFFACEVVKSVSGGRGVLVQHANGAKTTIAIIATAADPMATHDFLEMFFETQSTAGSEISYTTADHALRVVLPAIYRQMTDVEPPQTDAFALAALVIGVTTLDEIRKLVRQNNIMHREKAGWLVVPPAAAQPVTLIFQGSA